MKRKFIDTLVQNKMHPIQVLTPNMKRFYKKKNLLGLELELAKAYVMFCESENEFINSILQIRMKNIRKLLRAIKYGEKSYITKTAVL